MAVVNTPPGFKATVPNPEFAFSASKGTRGNRSGVDFKGTLYLLSRNTERRGWECEWATYDAGARLSGEAEDNMKHRAPWTNRSGTARAALYCDYHHDGRQHWIYMGYLTEVMVTSPTYRAPYDEILENRQGGKWSVVRGTASQTGQQWMAECRKFMGAGR